ncbi:MAG: hypothetical protein ACI9UT_000141 [Flavobacteriales bacterium]
MSGVIMLKQVVSALILWVYIHISFSVQATLQSIPDVTRSSIDRDISQVIDPPLTQLGTEYQNSVELLQNRFRIDYEVEEITMIFFREFGSAPIVLVQPDGSKLFQSDADDENIFWFDSSTYDMISIKNPTPGPWQAVGRITPESRVMVISDLVLNVDPLPKVIFSGEILKQTAYLTNGGLPIDYNTFRDVVELTISLSSTNNPNYNNFGAKAEIIAFFEDNGKGMDERPLDGIFTGQYNLAIAGGEWIPTFTVTTPMFSRQNVNPNIMLLANPIKVNVEISDGESGDSNHKLTVDALREHVDMSTLLIDGKVRFPNGDIQNFSITDMSANIREYLIVNYDYGVYRVKLTAYGNTIQGREFILDVPEYTFLSEEPEPVIVAVDPSIADRATEQKMNEQKAIFEQAMLEDEEKMSTSTLVLLIAGINLFILIVGGGGIWWLTLEKNSELKYKTSEDENSTDKKEGFFAKIFKRKPKEIILE